MDDLPQDVDHLGEVRKLGWVPPDDDALKMRADTSSIEAWRTSNGLPALIPRSEWVEVDLVSPLGRRCINNQKQCGGCSGWSGAQGSMRARLLRGEEFLRLSGAALYAQANGGHDNGSNIIAICDAIENNGTCLESQMDYPQIYSNQIPPGSLIYKEAKLKVTVDSFDSIATAIMMNMLPQFPLTATKRWIQNTGYDSNGVADLSNARQGNHSVHGAGLVCIDNVWYIIVPNTWALTWGPFVKQNPSWYAAFIARNKITPLDAMPLAGCVLIGQDHIDNCDSKNDGYAHIISLNPQGSGDMPSVAA